ncbi:hypothetical protein M569_02466 [Genlisea aurea]|uniref:Ubiquitin-specific protease family C19-related protein n=1 Tax=Genlisea aurea TaxID=192259 RepID=S8CXU2_9LAMI|nr:hypothetical protein M569_02466 [Genlisea aurea]
MGSRFPSHQLSNGLYVSGRHEQPKEKAQVVSSTSVSVPYTGGDIKKSGELGKMFDIPTDSSSSSRSRKSGPVNNAPPSRTVSYVGSATHSGQLNSVGRVSGGSVSMKKTNSGPLNKHGEPLKKSSGPQGQNSGPIPPVLPTTGLITSGPITSGPLNSSGAPQKASGPLDSTSLMKIHSTAPSLLMSNQAVTHLTREDHYSFYRSFPKLILWAVVLLFVMGFIAGGFILGAVRNPVLLVVIAALFAAVIAAFAWNCFYGRRAVVGFIAEYPDVELRSAKDGQFVKVSGVVTCGNVPLESSFQRVPRCVYTSTSLYEYRGWGSKAANPTHRLFTWGLRTIERHVADFYISDFQSGLRALVKVGYGAKVTPFVDESVVFDINPLNKDMSPELIRWLGQRNLSSDDRTMRLKEGYIKEGSTVSVMGVVRRNENVLMIVPPSEPVSTGCRWSKCVLPAGLEGVVLRCEASKVDVIPV